MNQPRRTFSAIRKFSLLIALLCTLAVLDTGLMLFRARAVDAHDALVRHLNTVRISVVKLEFVLDIFVVARQFEGQKAENLSAEVELVDGHFKSLNNAPYDAIFTKSGILGNLRGSILDGWADARGKVGRLDASTSEEEVLLVHDAVDMSTFVLVERLDVLVDAVGRERSFMLSNWRIVVLSALGLSILAALTGGYLFYRGELEPLGEVLTSASAAVKGALDTSGEGAIRDDIIRDNLIRDDLPGEAGALARIFKATFMELYSRGRKLDAVSAGASLRLRALGEVAGTVGKSLSSFEVFHTAIAGTLGATKADGAAVYLESDGASRLQVSKGFSESFFRDAEVIPALEAPDSPDSPDSYGAPDLSEADARKPRVFKGLDGLPEGHFKTVLRAEGIGTLVSAPVFHGGSRIGYFLAAYKDPGALREVDLAFFKALGSSVGVGVGYAKVFFDEHLVKRFLESVVEHAPTALGVFDKDGQCVIANAAFKKVLVGAEDTDLAGNFNVFEDEALIAQGHIDKIKGSFKGVEAEFIVEYGEYGEHGGASSGRRIMARSYPIFDASGNVPNVGLLYSELPNDNDAPRRVSGLKGG